MDIVKAPNPKETGKAARPGPGKPPRPPAGGRRPARRRLRRALGRLLSLLSVLMIVGAAGVALYPYYTNVRAGQHQKTLKVQFETQSAEVRQAYQTRTVKEGSPLTRIIIRRTGVDAVVVEGTSDQALAAGAGHYPDTPLPGEPGNVGIAGHRTMNGKPFNRNDELRTGDEIVLVTPFARHTYEVVPGFGGHANPWVTHPSDWSVVAQTDEPVLTLTTCHPKGSARERLIVRAKLVRSEPLA